MNIYTLEENLEAAYKYFIELYVEKEIKRIQNGDL